MIKIDSNGKAFCLSCADEVEGVLVEREENCTNCSMQSTWDKFQNELQNAPKKVGCLVCGFRSENIVEIEEFQENGCPDCERFQYKGTISFRSNQKLTPEQIDQIVFAIEVQIEEPADANGNDEEFSTREVLVTLEISE